MNLPDMLAGIVDHRLEGAACSGHWATFDPRGDREPLDDYRARTDDAKAICGVCPVLDRCNEVAQNMPATRRSGVWAAVAYDSNGRPTGGHSRPRTTETTKEIP